MNLIWKFVKAQFLLRLSGILLYEKRLNIPSLKNHHMLAIVEWAKTMLSNREQYCWGNIINSEEKKFNLYGPAIRTDDHEFRLEKYFLAEIMEQDRWWFSVWRRINWIGLYGLYGQKDSEYNEN